MKPTSPKLSEREQLLYSREQTRRLLGGVSIATIIRLEQSGVLTPVRLNKRSPTAMVFYRAKELLALAQPGGDDARS